MFKKVLPLTGIIMLRFFGLFIVLPIISLYANSFEKSAPFLIGLVVGGAYLTQLIFQTPFGILSDKFNRKIITAIGLLIFLLGSIICAFATHIELLVIGRLLQGVGAIGGVVSAQVSDLVKEEERTKAMAIMGGGIFLSFVLAMIVGPLIGASLGAKWLFLITAFFTFVSLIILFIFVPDSPKLSYKFDKNPSTTQSLRGKNIWLMNLSSFLEKMLMTLIFVIIPLILVDHFNFLESDLWKIYLPSALIGILALGPASILAEKKNRPKLVLILGIAFFLISYIAIGIADNLNSLGLFIVAVLIFFIGFAMLEPIMQSLVSKYAKAHIRGTVLGNFTTASYLGSFVGGMFGALLYHHYGLLYICISVILICIFWLISIFMLDNPQHAKNLYLPYTKKLDSILDKIASTNGVIEAYINETEKCIIIKYNTKLISDDKIHQYIKSLQEK